MPYMGVEHETKITYSKRTFHVFTYQAYNALGLIGSEHNGVAICDVDQRKVLCDEIAKESTGYFGTSKAQVAEFARIIGMNWEAFRAFINSHPRARYSI